MHNIFFLCSFYSCIIKSTQTQSRYTRTYALARKLELRRESSKKLTNCLSILSSWQTHILACISKYLYLLAYRFLCHWNSSHFIRVLKKKLRYCYTHLLNHNRPLFANTHIHTADAPAWNNRFVSDFTVYGRPSVSSCVAYASNIKWNKFFMILLTHSQNPDTHIHTDTRHTQYCRLRIHSCFILTEP